MATCAQLQTWLTEAEARYHSLQMGEREVSVRSDTGKMITYTAADTGRLLSYIGSLRAQVAACAGTTDTKVRTVLRFVPK